MNLELDEEAIQMVQDCKLNPEIELFQTQLAKKIVELFDEQTTEVTGNGNEA